MPQTPEISRAAKRGFGRKVETFHWLPILDSRITKRMYLFAELWAGTPYVPGNRVRGNGSDCAQLVPAFLDFMYRTGRQTPIPRMSQDTGTHNARAAWGTVKAVRQSFPSHVVRDATIEPGDIIITRATHDFTGPENPGHAMIAMPSPGTAIHAMPLSGVCITSVAVTRGILRVYRLEEKFRWA